MLPYQVDFTQFTREEFRLTRSYTTSMSYILLFWWYMRRYCHLYIHLADSYLFSFLTSSDSIVSNGFFSTPITIFMFYSLCITILFFIFIFYVLSANMVFLHCCFSPQHIPHEFPLEFRCYHEIGLHRGFDAGVSESCCNHRYGHAVLVRVYCETVAEHVRM